MRVCEERVAIVGVGGTGSYVLDFVAKTWVKDIHLYDGDEFFQHNAFRSPGALSPDELVEAGAKVVLHAERYGRMRRGIESYAVHLDGTNVARLSEYNTVFLCVDGGAVKAMVLETCMAAGVLVIDCGMGVRRLGVARTLNGTIRVTTCLPEEHDHAAKLGIALPGGDDDPEDEYARNAQMPELNALNAALAVIKWKKIRGIYNDGGRELHSVYELRSNKLFNRFESKA